MVVPRALDPQPNFIAHADGDISVLNNEGVAKGAKSVDEEETFQRKIIHKDRKRSLLKAKPVVSAMFNDVGVAKYADSVEETFQSKIFNKEILSATSDDDVALEVNFNNLTQSLS
ncbi:hypothetical protein B0H14DRAFT_3518487 [Mycena olivaceomarginata]|nr:hypothetical protein B0H14DRAFT_3518487 [Mycena olivaceomarginata]